MRFELFPLGPRRGARWRLRYDQDLLGSLLEIVDVAIVACGVDGRISHANRRASELLGAAVSAR